MSHPFLSSSCSSSSTSTSGPFAAAATAIDTTEAQPSAFVQPSGRRRTALLQDQPLHPINRPRPDVHDHQSAIVGSPPLLGAVNSHRHGMPDLLDDYEAYRRTPGAGAGRKRHWTPPSSLSFSSTSVPASRMRAEDVFARGAVGGAGHADGERPFEEDAMETNAGDSSFHTAIGSPSTANGRFDTLTGRTASDALARVQQQQQLGQQQEPLDHHEGPATKRRRGVAGAIIEGAINGLMYGGAAALTAYSLWSSWGRKDVGTDLGDQSPAPGTATGEPDRTTSQPQTGEEAPPPYERQQQPLNGRHSMIPGGFGISPPLHKGTHMEGNSARPSPSAFVGKTTPSKQRRQHVYVSNRRRRPLFESARLSYRGSPAPASPQTSQMQPPPAAELRQSDELPSTSTADAIEQHTDDDEDGDDAYLRFQDQMSRLIAEGQAALQSKSSDIPVEAHEDDLLTSSQSFLGLSSVSSPSLTRPSVGTTQRPSLGLESPSRIPQLSRRSQGPQSSTPVSRFRSAGEVNMRFARTDSPGSTSIPQLFSPEQSHTPFHTPSMHPSHNPSAPFVFGNAASASSSQYPSPRQRSARPSSSFSHQIPASPSQIPSPFARPRRDAWD